jgi:hypothetical protein
MDFFIFVEEILVLGGSFRVSDVVYGAPKKAVSIL